MAELYARPVLPEVDTATVSEPYLCIRLLETGAEVSGTTHAHLGQVNLPAPLQTGRDVYAEWQWDGQEVVVRNCRLGFLSITTTRTRSSLSRQPSNSSWLTAHRPTWTTRPWRSTCAWAGPWARTPSSGSSAPCPPAVRYAGRADRHGSRWRVNHPTPLRMSGEEAIATFADLVRQAVRCGASPEVAYILPLSSGRDSRSIFLELMELGCRPQACFTNHDFPP